MWHALWVTLAGEFKPRFGGWMFLTPEQITILHAWIRHDPYPCVYKIKETGFSEIKVFDLAGQLAWHTPSCAGLHL